MLSPLLQVGPTTPSWYICTAVWCIRPVRKWMFGQESNWGSYWVKYCSVTATLPCSRTNLQILVYISTAHIRTKTGKLHELKACVSEANILAAELLLFSCLSSWRNQDTLRHKHKYCGYIFSDIFTKTLQLVVDTLYSLSFCDILL